MSEFYVYTMHTITEVCHKTELIEQCVLRNQTYSWQMFPTLFEPGYM